VNRPAGIRTTPPPRAEHSSMARWIGARLFRLPSATAPYAVMSWFFASAEAAAAALRKHLRVMSAMPTMETPVQSAVGMSMQRPALPCYLDTPSGTANVLPSVMIVPTFGAILRTYSYWITLAFCATALPLSSIAWASPSASMILCSFSF
jgi:hypothetical protein